MSGVHVQGRLGAEGGGVRNQELAQQAGGPQDRLGNAELQARMNRQQGGDMVAAQTTAGRRPEGAADLHPGTRFRGVGFADLQGVPGRSVAGRPSEENRLKTGCRRRTTERHAEPEGGVRVHFPSQVFRHGGPL